MIADWLVAVLKASEPGAVESDRYHFQPFPAYRLPLGVTETLGLGRLGTKNAVLEARVQLLEPSTTNLLCC